MSPYCSVSGVGIIRKSCLSLGLLRWCVLLFLHTRYSIGQARVPRLLSITLVADLMGLYALFPLPDLNKLVGEILCFEEFL